MGEDREGNGRAPLVNRTTDVKRDYPRRPAQHVLFRNARDTTIENVGDIALESHPQELPRQAIGFLRE